MYLDVRKEMVIIVSILFIAFFLYSFFYFAFLHSPFPAVVRSKSLREGREWWEATAAQRII